MQKRNKTFPFILMGILFMFSNDLKSQNDMRGKLIIVGKVINDKSEILNSNLNIVHHNDTVIKVLNKDSFNVVLDRGGYYKLFFSASKYISKVVIADTRYTGDNEQGYEVPLEIHLEKGNDKNNKLIPVGSIFYFKETDLYETSPYHMDEDE